MKRFALASFLLALLVAAAARGDTVISFQAKGPYADPHNIYVAAGTDVEVAYYVGDVTDLNAWTIDVLKTGLGSGTFGSPNPRLDDGDEWALVPSTTVVFPHNSAQVRGMSYADTWNDVLNGDGELGVFTYTFDGPGPVTLDGGVGTEPEIIYLADNNYSAIPFTFGEMQVTIHLIPEPASLGLLLLGGLGAALRRRRA